jgi:hypothetical protein
MTVERFGIGHLLVPLRDDETFAVIVLDVNIGNISVLAPCDRHFFVETMSSLQGGVLTEFIMGSNKSNNNLSVIDLLFWIMLLAFDTSLSLELNKTVQLRWEGSWCKMKLN